MNRLSSSSAGFSAFRAADLDAADELPSAVLGSAFPKMALSMVLLESVVGPFENNEVPPWSMLTHPPETKPSGSVAGIVRSGGVDDTGT